MKYLTIGTGVLVITILLCLLSYLYIEIHISETERLLMDTKNALEQHNLAAAQQYFMHAAESWHTLEHGYRMLLDHDRTDGISKIFASLKFDHEADLYAVCQELLLDLQMIRTMELPCISNIL